MKLPQILIVIAAFASLFAGTPAAVHAQIASTPLTPAQTAKIPVVALPITDFKLLSANTGWASTGGRLFLTTDNGAHWKEISPPNPNQDHYASVVFYDADTAWVLLSGHPREGECADEDQSERDWAFHVVSTVDGGKTWDETHIKMPSCDSGSVGPSLNDNGNLTFADKHHGWLMLEHESGSAFSFGSLFATSDGGRSWHESNDNPGFYGNIRAYPNGDIWAVDGNNMELAVSHKGGNGFEDVSLPNPTEFGPDQEPSHSLPVFEDDLHGYVAGTYRRISGTKSTAVLFETGDGGRTWKPDRMLSNLVEGETVTTAVADSTWILPFAPQGRLPTLVKLRPNDRVTASDHKSSGAFRSCELSFLTPDEGWMNCSGKLSSTIDGGNTWATIAPRARGGVLTTDPITLVPAPKPMKTIEIKPAAGKSGAAAAVPRDTSPGHIGYASGIDQHLGFDTEYILSTGDMATWWVSSPYYDVGIYLPGAISGPTNAPSKKYPKRILLDPDWIDTVVGQGWGIIPIWSGPQAPCAMQKTLTHFFSADPAKAEVQGKVQANLAYISATNLGLDGTIIYVDIEEYDHSECGAAAKKYVKGWVNEMHVLGGSGSAGIYGGGDNANQDFADADEVYIGGNDNRVTVWHLNHGKYLSSKDVSGGLPDTKWDNKQRIRQYTENVKQTWGGVGPYRIDNDLVDATVVQSSGVKQYTFQAPVLSGACGLIVGIENAVNNGTALQMGTILCYDFSDNVITYSPITGTKSISALETANGINNLGQIIGQDHSGNKVLYTPGANPSLIPIGSPNGELLSINDAGWILGNDYDQYGIIHCMMAKPPYTSPVFFDLIGNVSCTNSSQGGIWPPELIGNDALEINGLGQITGSAEIGPDPDESNVEWSQVFLDDVENGTPGPSDNLSILATTQRDEFLVASGINNNGQIVGLSSLEDQTQGFVINTDGTIVLFPVWGSVDEWIAGFNDDVQIVGNGIQIVDNSPSGGGFTIDTQH